MKNTKTCGEAIVALLEAYGVDTVFGIPGVHTLELYRGLVGSPIRHILPRHEQGAGFMADGYARARGKPGVCFLITGPGLTNAATPIGQAYSDSIPLLVISSVNEAEHLGKGRGELHELPDQQKLMSACTAFSARIGTPSEFPAVLAKAFEVFTSKRPRPVHIEVPIDIFEHEVEEEWEVEPFKEPMKVDGAKIAAAVKLLQGAEAPLIIAGGGAIGAETPLLEIAEKLSAPVATSVAGTGLVACDNPLSLGPTLVSQATHDVVSASDMVLVAGSELASTDTWGIPFRFTGKLIRSDIDDKQFVNGPKADLNLHGDCVHALEQIASKLNRVSSQERRQLAERKVAEALADFEASLLPPEQLRCEVFKTVVNCLPDESLIVCDMTQIGYTGHSVFRPLTSGRMLFPQGYGTLGYGLPAGIGAKIGAPEKPVVVFTGDGGILYTLQEMMTAKEEGAGIIVVLWNNNSLKQIREGFIEREIEPIAVDPMVPNFQQLAQGFGWASQQIADIGELDLAVQSAFGQYAKRDEPVLIEVTI